MKILITGASGFVGSHVIKHFTDNDYEVFTLPREELDLLESSSSLLVSGRILEDTPINNIATYLLKYKIDTIVHLAANCGGIGYNMGNQGKLFYDNMQMGMNVLEAARLANVNTVVMIGTCCSYGHTPATIPFIEEELFDGMPEKTNKGYGLAKRTLVQMGMEYADQYGMKVVNLIPANMAGSHDKFGDRSHVIPAIIEKFENPIYNKTRKTFDGFEYMPEVRLWGTGNASREFLHPKDLARAIELSLQSNVSADPINIGSGHEIMIRNLAYLIKEIGNYESEIYWDSSKPDGQPKRSLDISRAKRVLEWEPQISLENIIKETIKWYRKTF